MKLVLDTDNFPRLAGSTWQDIARRVNNIPVAAEVIRYIADEMEAQAPVQEPSHFGARVIDAKGTRYVRWTTEPRFPNPWMRENGGLTNWPVMAYPVKLDREDS